MANMIGPNFGNELAAASIVGLAMSWTPEGEINYGPGVTSEQQAAVAAVLAAHNPALPDPYPATAQLLAAGLALTSTGAPALDGTYACDSASQATVTAEAVYIQSTGGPGSGTFSNGEVSLTWPDASGAMHTFNTTQFVAFAQAAAKFVTATKFALSSSMPSGKTWVAPSNAATIA